MAEKQFLVSVADALLFDDETDQLILKGKTLINSSIEQAVQSQEVFGGKGSQLQYEFNYQKQLTVSIEDTVVNETYIALQNNAPISRELRDYYFEEKLSFDSNGKASLNETPIGNVYVETEANHLTISPNGKDVTALSLANKEARVVYRYKAMMDHIAIDASKFPKSYRLVLNADFYTKNGKSAELQITVSRFKPDGALSLNMTHEGVSTSAMNGKALADDDNNYAHFDIKQINSNSVPLMAIAANTSDIALNSGETEKLTVIGIRGGAYANILNPDGTTFVSDDTDVVTVDSTGLVSYAGTGSTYITVENGNLSDKIFVECL